MKRWLKKHGRHLITVLGLVFIINSIWGLIIHIPKGTGWVIILNILVLGGWLAIILFTSGLASRVDAWWDKD